MPKKYLLIGIVAAALLAGAGYMFVTGQQIPGLSHIPLVRDIDLGNGIIAKDVPNGVDVTISTSSPTAPKAPSLERPITISTSMSAEAERLYKEKITTLRGNIKNNIGDSLGNWLTLGALYQEIGDFEGARQAFEYVSLMSPGNVVSYNNLGNLYHYYLKEYAKAEANFLTAIKNDPKYVLSYENLFNLYRYSYKTNTSAAEDILKQGIKNNPDDQDLKKLLNEYQASHAQ